MMGIQKILTDDLTGKTLKDDTEPTAIQMDGATFEVYLSDASKETLTKMFKGEGPIMRPVAKKAAAKKTTATKKADSIPLDKFGYSPADVRKWAKENDVPNIDKNGNENPVPDQGRLTQNVYTAYHEHMQGLG